jgi:hypothetical protein
MSSVKEVPLIVIDRDVGEHPVLSTRGGLHRLLSPYLSLQVELIL